MILELKETRVEFALWTNHFKLFIFTICHFLSYISFLCLSKMTSSYLQSMHVRQYHSYRKNSLTKTRFLIGRCSVSLTGRYLAYELDLIGYYKKGQCKHTIGCNRAKISIQWNKGNQIQPNPCYMRPFLILSLGLFFFRLPCDKFTEYRFSSYVFFG